MNSRRRTQTSKFLSLILRHDPRQAGLRLDDQGWVAVADLLAGTARAGMAITMEELKEVVETNSKHRFAFSEDGLRIRANQGHSVPVDLGLPPAKPPDVLFHGTVAGNLPSILASGLERRCRQHVHLSPDMETARRIGSRRGDPVVLVVDARGMALAGHLFYCAANGVWLTDSVPARFISMWSSPTKEE